VNPGKKSLPGLGKTFSLVAILTFLSKFIGLARDIVVLQVFGAGLVTDAYNYACMLTNQILVLFGGVGGPFHQCTIAVIQPRKNAPDVGKLMCQLLSATAICLLLVSGLILLLEPIGLDLLIQLQGKPEVWKLATQHLHIMLPMITIAGLLGILYGISNVYGEFKWTSLSPAFASIAIIVAVYFFPDHWGYCLAWGTMIGAVMQLLAQLPATLPFIRWQFSTKPEPGLREYTAMFWPAVISTSIGTLTVLSFLRSSG